MKKRWYVGNKVDAVTRKWTFLAGSVDQTLWHEDHDVEVHCCKLITVTKDAATHFPRQVWNLGFKMARRLLVAALIAGALIV